MKFNLKYTLGMLIPAAIAILIFAAISFFVVIPVAHDSLLQAEKNNIEEVTNSIFAVIENLKHKADNGTITQENAQKEAVDFLQKFRYGKDNKDYFWVTDTFPAMIVHPYKPTLNAKNLRNYEDKNGKKLFNEAVSIVQKHEKGYLNYFWQWKDDSIRIVPKLSFVRLYRPWNWVVGTGIYINDVDNNIRKLTFRITLALLALILFSAMIMFYFIRKNLKANDLIRSQNNRLKEKEIEIRISLSQLRSLNEELSQSEKKYRNIFDKSHDAIVLMKNNIIIDCNEAAMKALQTNNREDIISKSPSEISPLYQPDGQLSEEKELKMIESAKKQGYARFEWVHKTFGGAEFPVEVSLTPIPMFENEVIHASWRDISEEKRIFRNLVQSEERIRIILDNLPVAVWTMNENYELVFISGNIEKLIGFTPEEIFREHSKLKKDRISKTDLKRIETCYQLLISEQKPFEIEYQFRRKDGTTVWLFEAANCVSETKVRTVNGIIADISARKEAEMQLFRFQKDLQKLVDERTDALNRTVAKLKEANIELVERKKVLEAANTQLKNQQDEIFQLNEELKQNNEELFATNDKLFSQKKELEDALAEINKTHKILLQTEKLASIGILSAGIAHEINNPINFISSGLSGLIKIEEKRQIIFEAYRNTIISLSDATVVQKIDEKYQTNTFTGAARDMIKNMQTGVDRTIQIIKSLRSFVRSDDSSLQFIDIHESVEAALLMLYNRYKNKARIIKNFAEIPKIQCFAGGINQVIMNLLSNAIDAVSENGLIEISTAIFNQESVLLAIKDNGCGISPENIPKIFDPFFTTKEPGSGTGLGLSIVYNIVQQHGGQIEVRNEQGKGTVFIVTLPVFQNPKND